MDKKIVTVGAESTRLRTTNRLKKLVIEPLVSIIVPTYNEQANIDKCFKSILAQNYKNIELIVVDNYSKDKTLKIVRKYTKKCYSFGNERSTQRNFGARKAHGNWLLFIDADMRLTKNCLNEAIKKVQKGKFIIAFPELSQGQNFWEKSISFERNLYQKEKKLAAARLFPKKLFLKLNGYDQNLIAGEDWDLSIRAQDLGYRLIITNGHLIHNEKAKSLKEILKKKNYYSQNIHHYAQKHPKEFKLQSSLKIRIGIYLKNWKALFRNPPYTFGFIFLKALSWYNWSRLKKY